MTCHKTIDSMVIDVLVNLMVVFFFQAEDGIRDLVRSRGLGDVYKRQIESWFDVRVEKALESGLHLGRSALDSLLSDLVDLSLIHI